MVEKLQQDSEKSLDVHKKDVLEALAGVLDADAGGAPAAEDNPMFNEAVTHAAGGSMFSAAVSAHENLASTSKHTSSLFVGGGPKGKQNSLFVGGGSVSKTEHKSVPLVPPSYGEKKAMAGNTVSKPARDGNLFSRAQISGMSLTGSSSAGGKPAPIKGASVNNNTAKLLKANALMQELNVVNQEMVKGYTKGSKRLMDALKKGVDAAEDFVHENPDSLKNTSPQFQQSMSPSRK